MGHASGVTHLTQGKSGEMARGLQLSFSIVLTERKHFHQRFNHERHKRLRMPATYNTFQTAPRLAVKVVTLFIMTSQFAHCHSFIQISSPNRDAFEPGVFIPRVGYKRPMNFTPFRQLRVHMALCSPTLILTNDSCSPTVNVCDPMAATWPNNVFIDALHSTRTLAFPYSF